MVTTKRENDGDVERLARIAALNDQCRREIGTHGTHGPIVSSGIMALPVDARQEIIAAVRSCPVNDALDPDGERDTGYVNYKGLSIFWKIFYFDRALVDVPNLPPGESDSKDPADATMTLRLLVIMFVEELLRHPTV